MTLIIGTAHWNGVCCNTDTRATNVVTRKYKDNAQKLSHVHGGIGMLARGDRVSAIMFREVLRRRLEKFEQSNIKFPPSVDLQDIYETLFLDALKNLRGHPTNQQRPIYDVSSEGIIGVNITDQPLTLNREESSNLIRVIVEGKKINSAYKKCIGEVSKCASGQIEKARLSDFNQNTLFRYKVKLFDDSSDDIYEIEKIPFGKIIALGSGSRFEYGVVESKILSYVLFGANGEDVAEGAFHLGMIHHYAEEAIPVDSRFDFRTFGGAVVSAVIATDKNGIGFTNIMLGGVIDRKTRSIISKVSDRGGKLWVTTRDGVELELEEFPDKINAEEKLSWR